MNIIKYLKKHYSRNTRISIHEDNSFTFFVDYILKNYSKSYEISVDIIYVKSSKLYPCKLSFKQFNKHFIVWDSMFWDEYEKYYKNMLLLEFNKQKQEYTAINDIISIVNRVLSYALEEYPFISFELAKKGAKHILSEQAKKQIMNIIQYELKPGEYNSDVLIAKLFVFFHEKTHIEYRVRDKIYYNDLTEIKNLLKFVLLSENMSKDFKDSNMFLQKNSNNYSSMILDEIEKFERNKQSKQTPEVEELLCDFYAIKEMFAYFKQIFINKKEDTILSAILTNTTYVTSFEMILKYQSVQWIRTLRLLDSFNGNYTNINKVEIEKYLKNIEMEKDFVLFRNMLVLRMFIVYCNVNHNKMKVGYFISPEKFNQLYNQITLKCSDTDFICDLFYESKKNNKHYSFYDIKKLYEEKDRLLNL